MPSFILIRPNIWPQYTNVTDRQDRQRSDRIGRIVLQTVAQKRDKNKRLYDRQFHRSFFLVYDSDIPIFPADVRRKIFGGEFGCRRWL